MRVATLMTRKPYTLPRSASLDEAMQLMAEHDLRHLPVIEGEDLVGVLSDRDLLDATGWLPARVRELYADSRTDPRKRTVGELMHARVRTLSPEDTVVTAAVELVASRIGCLPVLQDGALVGILTETDLVRAFADAARARTLSGDVDPPVSQRMTRAARTVTSDTPIGEAFELMREMDVRHLPVMQDQRVVGIVSDRDLRRAHGSNRSDETPVDEVMTRGVATIEPEKPLSYAADLVLLRKIGGLPVVDDGRVVGMLTLTDLLDHCLEVLRDPDVVSATQQVRG